MSKCKKNNEVEDQYHWGIQKFKNAQDAFNNMSQEWGENIMRFEHLTILTDESFEKIIKSRALDVFGEHKWGKIDHEQLNNSIGRGKYRNDRLLDFNFFLYSQRSDSYYTSIMEFKDDFVFLWSKRQWKIAKELWNLYSFDSLINEAEKVFLDRFSSIDDEDLYWDTAIILDWLI